MSFTSFGTHIFGDKTLQLPLNLSKLIMNGYFIIGFKSITVDLIIHGSSFNDTHLVWSRAKELLKLNNTMSTCLIRLKIILHYS